MLELWTIGGELFWALWIYDVYCALIHADHPRLMVLVKYLATGIFFSATQGFCNILFSIIK
jgi:hypothetical protein